MRTQQLAKLLEGIHTIESVQDLLQANRKKAISLISRLRRQGYVKTKRLSNNKRVYSISVEHKLGGESPIDIINAHSPIKIAAPEIHYIYGRKISVEEALLSALKTKSLRTILAALALFKKIHNWPLLYRWSQKEHLQRQVGALYDLAKTVMRVRRMSERFRKNALPRKSDWWEYLLPHLQSKDFKEIERTWKVHLPFNKKDLEAYV